MFLIKLGATILALWIIFGMVFGIARQDGESMNPKILDGDVMFFYRLEKDYYIGDVVAYKRDGDIQSARVVAKGGDVVDITSDGKLVVNGSVQSEEIYYPTYEVPDKLIYPYTVEEGSYFVLCDYRTVGDDSREYGSLALKDIKGKVITIVRRRGI
jgi:signal peptidase I